MEKNHWISQWLFRLALLLTWDAKPNACVGVWFVTYKSLPLLRKSFVHREATIQFFS